MALGAAHGLPAGAPQPREEVRRARPRTGRRPAGNWPRSAGRGRHGAHDMRAAGTDRANGGPRNESAHRKAAQPAHSALRNRLGTERAQSERLESAGNGPAHRARAALSRSGRKSGRARRARPAVNGAVRLRDALWARLRK